MTEFYSYEDAIDSLVKDDVPILIPVFNTVSYAKFMVDQLLRIGLTNFVLLDNNSTYPPMVEYLAELSQTQRVMYLKENFGPRAFIELPQFLDLLPEHFILTDPDLVFNKDLPVDFIAQMKQVQDYYNVSKIGFALEIFDEQEQARFFDLDAVLAHEKQFYEKEIVHDGLNAELYAQIVDTTFALYNKSKYLLDIQQRGRVNFNTSSLRIGGRFTCQHMGWWREPPLTFEEREYYRQHQKWSSTESRIQTLIK